VTEDDSLRHTGAWNSFKFDPEPLHDDVLTLADQAEALGYRLLFREAGYTLEEVSSRLREEGASSFLRIVRLQEDISPKAPTLSVEQYIGERLARLKPQSELVITDPYLFTSTRQNDASDYGQSVARIVSPLLSAGASLIVVVDPKPSDPIVEQAVISALKSNQSSLQFKVIRSGDFHDRFWIADRARGVIMGTSLNKIGHKIFFIDALTSPDVAAVMAELDGLVL